MKDEGMQVCDFDWNMILILTKLVPHVHWLHDDSGLSFFYKFWWIHLSSVMQNIDIAIRKKIVVWPLEWDAIVMAWGSLEWIWLWG